MNSPNLSYEADKSPQVHDPNANDGDLHQQLSHNVPFGASRVVGGGTKTKISRSRKGCKNCKRLKIKCNEAKPSCSYCVRSNAKCDYSIELTWGGRPYKNISRRKDRFSAPNTPGSADTEEDKRGRSKSTPIQFVVNNPSSKSGLVSTPTLQTKARGEKRKLESPADTPMTDSASYSSFISSSSIRQSSSSDVVTDTKRPNTQPESTMGPTLLPHGTYPQQYEYPISNDDMNQNSNTNEVLLSANDNQSEENQLTPSDHVMEQDIETSIVPSSDISDGIKSLSWALDRVSNGTHTLNENSDIFNMLMSKNPAETATDYSDNRDESPSSSSDSDLQNEVSENSPDDDVFLQMTSIYPQRQQSNFVTDFLSPQFAARGTRYPSFNISDQNNAAELGMENELYSDFTYIPPPLEPLPDFLRGSPFYRSLMHFWVNVASHNLVPAPSHIYKENPFKVLLPQMAMSIPSILMMLLAFSAKNRSELAESNGAVPRELVTHLLGKACSELLLRLKDKEEAKSDGTLATILLFSCYEVFNCEDFERHRTHTTGARQIIRARRGDELSGTGYESNIYKPNLAGSRDESDIAFFLMRWFSYVDIMGALSSTKNPHKYLTGHVESDRIESLDILESDEINEHDVSKDPKKDIDYLLGFDVKFLPQFADIALLIRETNDFIKHSEPENGTLPIFIISKALMIKENIVQIYERGETRRQAQLDHMIGVKASKRYKPGGGHRFRQNLSDLIQQDNILRCTNKIFCDMAILNLYRRVLKLPREAKIVQDIANGIGEILESEIAPLSSAELCSIFCLFCAGCESLSSQKRSLFADRFIRLAQSGSVSAKKSLQIMRRCWDTGEDWIEASEALNIDIVLL